MRVAHVRLWMCWVILLATGVPGPALANGVGVAIGWSTGAGESAVQLFELEAPWGARTPMLTVDASPRLNYAEGRLYALSNAAGTVTVIDPGSWSIERVYALGPSSRPIDIAVWGPIAYITREGATRLLKLDLTSGTVTEATDFAPLADADGVPDLGTMIIDGSRLLVQVRRLNENALEFFERPAYIAIVGLPEETLVDVDPVSAGIQGIALQGTAPHFRMQVGPRPDRLFVSASHGTHNLEGGIEMIDLETLRSLGIVAAESDPHSGVCCDMAPFVMVSPSRGFFTFSTDSTLSSHLHTFTLEGGIDPVDLHTSVGYEAANHVHEPFTDQLFVPVYEDVPGFHVFEAGSSQRLSDRLVETPGPISDLVLLCDPGEPPCVAIPAVPVNARWSLAALILLFGLVAAYRARTP